MNIHVDDNNEVLLGVQTDEIDLRAGDTINLGSSDYNDLTNKPSIEGVELVGDVSLEDLGVAYAEDIPTDVSELNNDAGYIKSPNVVYCTCDTAAGTAAKVATIVSGTLTELHAGDQAIVKFTNTNTASNPTLNIAGTGAKAIKRYGTTAVGTTQATSWTAGASFACIYDGANWALVSWINTAYSEISEANITNGTSSSTGLISGRRAKKAVEAFAPVKDVEVDGESVVVDGVAEITMPTIPTDVSELINDAGYITEDDIPPLVTDLGYVDAEGYDYDVYAFFDTLLASGEYKFVWGDGDDFEYFVVAESLLDEDGNGYVYQKYWYTEEGSKYLYHRSAKYEDGEIVDSYIDNYLTLNEASSMFASSNHAHYESVNKAKSVWDYCNSSELSFNNSKPFMIYKDSLNDENWLIEKYIPLSRPADRFIRVTALADSSAIYQRSGVYNNGTIVWDDWYKYTGTVFTP